MIFDEKEKRKAEADFEIKVHFIEIYNEEIHDLLSTNPNPTKSLIIREKEGSIGIDGVSEILVNNAEDMFNCLEKGTLGRSVASTKMNSESSRSHAIFSINVNKIAIEENDSALVEK